MRVSGYLWRGTDKVGTWDVTCYKDGFLRYRMTGSLGDKLPENETGETNL